MEGQVVGILREDLSRRLCGAAHRQLRDLRLHKNNLCGDHLAHRHVVQVQASLARHNVKDDVRRRRVGGGGKVVVKLPVLLAHVQVVV